MTRKIMLELFAVLAIGLLLPVYADNMSPLKQFNMGIPIDEIQCNDNKVLMESTSGKPYCLTENTAAKLADRGSLSIVVEEEITFGEEIIFDKNIEGTINDPLDDSGLGENVESTIDMPIKTNQIIDESINASSVDTPVQTQPVNVLTNITSPTITMKYQKPEPILNPTNNIVKTLLPQGGRVDALIEIFKVEDRDEFAIKMLELHDDEMEEMVITINNQTRYFTEKGMMEFSDTPSGYYNFKYKIYGADRIHEQDAEKYTYKFIELLGITPEDLGKPKYCDHVCEWTYIFSHEKNGYTIVGDGIITRFMPGYTEFISKDWHINYDDIELFDLTQSRQNALEYILTMNELTQPDCNVKYNKVDDDSNNKVLDIINGRFVYMFYVGTCQTPYMDGHWARYTVTVDAITGAPLYAESMLRI